MGDVCVRCASATRLVPIAGRGATARHSPKRLRKVSSTLSALFQPSLLSPVSLAMTRHCPEHSSRYIHMALQKGAVVCFSS